MDPHHHTPPRMILEPEPERRPRLLIKSDDENLLTGRAQLNGRDVPIAAAMIDLETGRCSRARLEFDLLGGLDLEFPADVTIKLSPCAPGLLEIAEQSSGALDGSSSVKRVSFVPSVQGTAGRLAILNVLATLPDLAWSIVLADLAVDASSRRQRETRGFPLFDAFELLESVARRALEGQAAERAISNDDAT